MNKSMKYEQVTGNREKGGVELREMLEKLKAGVIAEQKDRAKDKLIDDDMVLVKYSTNQIGQVPASELDNLIKSKKITAFLQNKSWNIIDKEKRQTVKRKKTIVPICCYCKKIRANNGVWKRADFIEKKRSVVFSHGICVDCAVKHYPKYFKKISNPAG